MTAKLESEQKKKWLRDNFNVVISRYASGEGQVTCAIPGVYIFDPCGSKKPPESTRVIFLRASGDGELNAYSALFNKIMDLPKESSVPARRGDPTKQVVVLHPYWPRPGQPEKVFKENVVYALITPGHADHNHDSLDIYDVGWFEIDTVDLTTCAVPSDLSSVGPFPAKHVHLALP